MDKKNFNLKEAKRLLEQKKKLYPMEWLGRSLAYNPYQPRPIKELLKKTPSFLPQNIYSINPKENFLENCINLAKKASCFVSNDLENLTFIRRYIQNPLIYDFVIFDEYQLLESLVYGADAVFLYPKFLSQKELKEMRDFALKIGLEAIFVLENKSDLTKAIFAKADILNINHHLELLALIPNSKIILSTQEKKEIDCVIMQ